jgi:NADPH:quinone reductase
LSEKQLRLPRTILGHTLGPPESYRIETVPLPSPGPGQLRARIRAAGVSFVDVLLAAGKYQLKLPTPYTPGTEYVGEVDAIGAGVTELSRGDRIVGVGLGGAFAEYAVTKASDVYACPPGLDDPSAACFRATYSTAYHALVQRARLQSRETCLVLGAAGAVGLASIHLAKVLGARVVASASALKKRELALAEGADTVIDSGSPNWRDLVSDACGGRGPDVVVDPVGGRWTELAFRSLTWGGRHLVIGFAAGEIPQLKTNLPLLKGAALIGVDARQFALHEPELQTANWHRLCELQQRFGFKPYIGRHYPFSDFQAAMNAAASSTTVGRVVLQVT